MASFRNNGFRIGLALIGLLVLSGCKTTSEGWGVNVDRIERTIEQTLVEDDWSTGVDLIRHIPKSSYHEIMPWLKERAHTFPPVYLYAMADRMYKIDNEGAVRWFVSARVRHTYDLLRCKNAGALQRLDVFSHRFHKTAFKFAGRNPERAQEVALEGLAWDENNPIHRTSPIKECTLAGENSRYSSRGDSPFSNVYYPIMARPSYGLAKVKPSWTHPEILDLARVKTKRFVEDLKYKTTKKKDRYQEAEDEDDYPRNYTIRRWNSKPWRRNLY
jgi:hypothetical protein